MRGSGVWQGRLRKDGDANHKLRSIPVKVIPCPRPEACRLGQGGLCKPYGRLNVLIGEDDELGTFIFRITGHNSIRTLSARLK